MKTCLYLKRSPPSGGTWPLQTPLWTKSLVAKIIQPIGTTSESDLTAHINAVAVEFKVFYVKVVIL